MHRKDTVKYSKSGKDSHRGIVMSINPPIDNREPQGPQGEGVLSSPPLKEAPSEEGGPVFQCKVCGQIFTNLADLEEHMLSHGGARGEDNKKPAGVA